MKYYRVKAKCGHVGRNNYIEKNIYIRAENGREAASKVRVTPRVKHNKPDAIINVKQITLDEYLDGLKIMNEDPYFRVTSRQEQRKLCRDIDNNVIREPTQICYKKTAHMLRKIRENDIVKEYKKPWREWKINE